jgi:hypothetical protein
MALRDTFRDRLIDPIGTGKSCGTPMALPIGKRPAAARDTYRSDFVHERQPKDCRSPRQRDARKRATRIIHALQQTTGDAREEHRHHKC